MQVRPITAGYVGVHTCDVPACVRPDHLVVGTHADNNRDMDAKGRRATGQRHGNSRLTESDIIAIRAATGRTNTAIAKDYGIHMSYVGQIRSRKSWKHV